MPRCPKPRYTKTFYDWDEVPLFLETTDLCNLLHLSEPTIIRMLNSGEIKGVRFGKQWRVNKSDFMEYCKVGEAKQLLGVANL